LFQRGVVGVVFRCARRSRLKEGVTAASLWRKVTDWHSVTVPEIGDGENRHLEKNSEALEEEFAAQRRSDGDIFEAAANRLRSAADNDDGVVWTATNYDVSSALVGGRRKETKSSYRF
jgi:hypothetical protein